VDRAAGGVTGLESLGLRSPLPDVELGECVSRSEGGEMLFDPLETLRLEAGQQCPKASPDRQKRLPGLGQTGWEKESDLVTRGATVVGLADTHDVAARESLEHAGFE
jgi:hypothetical protein